MALADVYITDHQPKAAQYYTANEADSEAFFNYQTVLEEYVKEPVNRVRPATPKIGKYARGSIAQRIFEPTLYSEKLTNGTVFYDLLDCDIGGIQEEKMRRVYEAHKKYSDVVLEGDADDDDMRKAILE